MRRARPRVAITLGDPAGVGPEVTLKAISRPEVLQACRPVIVGDGGVLTRAQRTLRGGEGPAGTLELPEGVELVDLGNVPPEAHRWGERSAVAGRAGAEYVEHAVQMALAGHVAAVVTAPLNKEALRLAEIPYPGHTEMLAALTGAAEYAMMLAGPTLRVIHVSTHVSLEEAIRRVRAPRILSVIRLADRVLRREGIMRPRVAVAGLNPHAGEHGLFGGQDEQEIRPAVEAAWREGIDATGPHPPDTVFWHAQQGRFDIVVAMYHDQGHIPAKLAGFDRSVNVTVGLPIIRTSVDHGTAFDIAGTGVASDASMVQAILYAVRLAMGTGGAKRRTAKDVDP
ncbi:4-hydroxythreonine-4-phosphate dehydrogenase PdxA [Limnochorda pilosa]|uniref:4-hydroxythreonine-4-phosphate dehydrogenase n=1 Tax=Limnochorda pilosa TaxID=1555112 RepID=A0A0K2SLF7_LIMPI|nr:4-hydroxythreonine-4-phosphate dehydrogenase [Limnochorda pilosa]